MSEETTPAKKAARKSVRKKSASKRAPRKSASSESSTSEEQLSLDGAQPDKATAPSHEEASNPEAKKEGSRTWKGREPKSGVRDARREPSEEPDSTEVSEKLVPEEEGPGEDRRERSQDLQRDQGRNEQSESRGRGRNRGRGRGQDRERPEKREPKPRVQVNGKDMAKKAWKIFESEVTEEGLALLDDNSLRDYARSSFNAARLFLEEKGRVIGRKEKSKKESKKDKDDD
jgi:hypothetical protein